MKAGHTNRKTNIYYPCAIVFRSLLFRIQLIKDTIVCPNLCCDLLRNAKNGITHRQRNFTKRKTAQLNIVLQENAWHFSHPKFPTLSKKNRTEPPTSQELEIVQCTRRTNMEGNKYWWANKYLTRRKCPLLWTSYWKKCATFWPQKRLNVKISKHFYL